MKNAQDIMSQTVLSVRPDTNVSELAKILTENNINGVPVVDENKKLLGVVTENDLLYQKKKVHIPTIINILDSFIYLESQEKMRAEMEKITGVTVEKIFSRDPVTVSPDTPIDEVATIMTEQNIHTIPVVKDGTIVGVIGKRDIIKTIIP